MEGRCQPYEIITLDQLPRYYQQKMFNKKISSIYHNPKGGYLVFYTDGMVHDICYSIRLGIIS